MTPRGGFFSIETQTILPNGNIVLLINYPLMIVVLTTDSSPKISQLLIIQPGIIPQKHYFVAEKLFSTNENLLYISRHVGLESILIYFPLQTIYFLSIYGPIAIKQRTFEEKKIQYNILSNILIFMPKDIIQLIFSYS